MNLIQYNLISDMDKKPALVKENIFTYNNIDRLEKCDDICNVMCDCFNLHNRIEEYAYIIAVNTRLEPIGIFELSHGAMDCTIVDMKSMFMRLLLLNAYGFFVIHNHPTGNIKPSKDDVKTTEKIKQLAELHEIRLYDHIIIGGKNKYYSIVKNMK